MTVKWFKAARLQVTRYLAGTPLPLSDGVSLARDGLPAILPLELRRKLRERDPISIRYTLTLLSITRGIMGGNPLNLDSITSPSYPNQEVITQLDEFGKQFMDTFKIEEYPFWAQASLHWSAKAGPNGNALGASLKDAEILIDKHPTLIESLIKLDPTMRDHFNRLGRLKPFLSKIHSYFIKRVPSTFLIRKLSIRKDREAKTRVFAILDYWSQQSMLALHQHLFEQLKKLPSDMTFNQDLGIPRLSSLSGPFYSIDLKDATDRFPMIIQKNLLAKVLADADKASAWADILTSEPYTLMGHEPIKYMVGQPMGAYSSWPAFSLCHHMLVQYAANQVNQYPFAKYVLLGDDIVIADKAVAEEYLRLLRLLDIPTSDQKTHISMSTFEFTKRWFVDGIEVTPYPVHGLIETSTKWWYLWPFLKDQVKKGYLLPQF